MDTITLELFVIILMVFLNGFFAMSEFAIISVRKSRIAQLVAEGLEQAKIIERFQQDPHRLLAVVQIGMTLTGATASTLGGIIAVDNLRPWLKTLDSKILRDASEPVAATTMVLLVSYALLVIGELAPKALGLQYSDTLAFKVAKPVNLLSRLTSPAVSFLTISSKAIIGLFGFKTTQETFITREEVQHIVAEGHESGVFSESEHEYIRNIFEFTHTCVREVMVPRTRIVALESDCTREYILETILEAQYSRYPVYSGTIEDVIGVVHGKDLLGRLVKGETVSLQDVLRKPVFVPEGKKVNELLKEMQRTRNHMALVVDEYGGLAGLVTTEDLLEELVGEIEDEHDAGDTGMPERLHDGSILVNGLMPMFDLNEFLNMKTDENLPYDTVAGFVLHELGHMPLPGESFEWHGHTIYCEDVTRTAVLKVRLSPPRLPEQTTGIN